MGKEQLDFGDRMFERTAQLAHKDKPQEAARHRRMRRGEEVVENGICSDASVLETTSIAANTASHLGLPISLPIGAKTTRA